MFFQETKVLFFFFKSKKCSFGFYNCLLLTELDEGGASANVEGGCKPENYSIFSYVYL